jgi:hypothetical protein
VVGDPRCAATTQLFNAAVPQGPSFTFRTTVAGFPVQESLVRLSDGSTRTFDLDPGQSFSVEPRELGTSGLMVAYVRISSPTTTFVLEGDTTHTPVMAFLQPLLTYDLLIVPSDPSADFAPQLLSSRPTDWAQGIDIDQGVHVGALTVNADGTPLGNARMILRRGARPSTVGVSDSTGALDLWTRAGTMSATVVPPDGSGLAQANIDATNDLGVVLGTNDASLSLRMQWAAIASGTMVIDVRDTDGTTPVASARVHLSSHDRIGNAGTLTVSTPGADDVMLAASGSVDDDVVTDASGRATFQPHPIGVYDVTIVPGAGTTAAAVTTSSVMLSSTTLPQTIALAAKVNLTGTLLPAPASKGSVITAIDTGEVTTGTSFSAQAGADGSFSLSVNPNRSYEIVIQPGAGQTFGRTLLPAAAAMIGSSDMSIGTMTLPRGLTYTGYVTGGGNNIGDVFIQVFCVSSAPSCVDPTVSLAEATSAADGSFKVVLPNP